MSFEVSRVIAGQVDYSAVNREYRINVPRDLVDAVVDLQLSFFGQPAMQPLLASQALTGCHDLRFYLNRQDISSQILKQLRASVARLGESAANVAYKAGADRYMDFVKRFGTLDQETASDATQLQQYLQLGWDKKLTRLGDHTVGWSGNLHAINFLYSYIPLDPISISLAWKDFLSEHPQKLAVDLCDLGTIELCLSNGPAPSIEPFDPQAFIPTGRVRYYLEILSTNPLEKPINDIFNRLTLLNQELEALRVTYLQPIATQVSQVEADLKLSSSALIQELNNLAATVNNISH
jgi:hypothetical protein